MSRHIDSALESVRPADVRTVGRGAERVYIVVGVKRNGAPSHAPSRPMTIKRSVRLRGTQFDCWALYINYVRDSYVRDSEHRTLRDARLAASLAEDNPVTSSSLTDMMIRSLHAQGLIEGCVAADALSTDKWRRYEHESSEDFARRRRVHEGARAMCVAVLNARKAVR